jgi:hypothetical protein
MFTMFGGATKHTMCTRLRTPQGDEQRKYIHLISLSVAVLLNFRA